MLEKERRHLRRYREIAGVLVSHGLGWSLDRLGIGEFVQKKSKGDHVNAPAHMRMALEELGPTFVKLGQLLSTRPDLIPKDYYEELTKLQDTAPTFDFGPIREKVEAELAAPLDEIFEHFDTEPFAAASLGQVHGATLLDGTPVIVKVQRPNLEEIVSTDLEILLNRAKFLESHWEKAKTYGVMEVAEEFAFTMREAIDYTREATNTDKIREAVAGHEGVLVPKVYWEYTTKRVLTMERMFGMKITDVPKTPTLSEMSKDISSRFASVMLQQILVDGFFHGDPHPGNVLVSESGEIMLIDCGEVGRLDTNTKSAAVRMLLAFQEQNTRAFADEVISIGVVHDEVDMKRFTNDISKILRSFYSLPARAINVGNLLLRVLDVSADHRVRLPAVFANLGQVLAYVDGICRQLDPEFNFTEAARNYAGKAVASELRWELTLPELYRALVGLRGFLVSLPEQLERIMRKAVEGTMRIEFKHQGLEDVSDSLRHASNRISIAVITGAIIVGSSLIMVAEKGPRSNNLFGLPILGVLGFIIATIFGVVLIISIIRSDKRR